MPQTMGPHMWTPFYTCLLKDIQPVRGKGVSGLNSEFPDSPTMLFTPRCLP